MQRYVSPADCCGNNQLLITQEQGDNSPTIIYFPYDVTGVIFSGTIKFPAPVLLALDSGITVLDIETFVGSISSNILTITSISSGAVYIGMPVNGLGVLSGTNIIGFGTGLGGTGTYILNQGQTVASTNMETSRVSMQLTSAQTQNVPVGQYAFDLWTESSGDPTDSINTDPITGFFTINAAITRIS